MIDVVIPAYNAHGTIEATIESIITQTMKEKRITIVNDAGKPYHDIVAKYKNQVDIREIDLEQNGGPGISRQAGLQIATYPYITFIDADDIFLDAMFFDKVCLYLDHHPDVVLLSAGFIEEIGPKNWTKHTTDLTWVFGKVYRLSTLKKYNIGFSELRANEDLEFNQKIFFSIKEPEAIEFLNDHQVYYWRFRSDSITRINNAEYSFHNGLIGAIQAKDRAYSFEHSDKEKAKQAAVKEIFQMYNGYNTILNDRPEHPEWLREVFAAWVEFYNKWAKEDIAKMTRPELAKHFNERHLTRCMHVIPKISFDEFMEQLNRGYIDDLDNHSNNNHLQKEGKEE